MVGQSTIDTVVDAPRVEVGLKLRVDRLRVLLVKPKIQFFSLLRRERVYSVFDVLYGAVHAHICSIPGGQMLSRSDRAALAA